MLDRDETEAICSRVKKAIGSFCTFQSDPIAFLFALSMDCGGNHAHGDDDSPEVPSKPPSAIWRIPSMDSDMVSSCCNISF